MMTHQVFAMVLERPMRSWMEPGLGMVRKKLTWHRDYLSWKARKLMLRATIQMATVVTKYLHHVNHVLLNASIGNGSQVMRVLPPTRALLRHKSKVRGSRVLELASYTISGSWQVSN